MLPCLRFWVRVSLLFDHFSIVLKLIMPFKLISSLYFYFSAIKRSIFKWMFKSHYVILFCWRSTYNHQCLNCKSKKTIAKTPRTHARVRDLIALLNCWLLISTINFIMKKVLIFSVISSLLQHWNRRKMSGFLAAVKSYGLISLFPVIVVSAIYYDWSRTQVYKKNKEYEKLGLRRDIDKKINL